MIIFVLSEKVLVKVFFGLLLVVTLACAVERINVTKTTNAFYSATNPAHAQIVMTRPDRDFVELATVGVTGINVNDIPRMHGDLKVKAAHLGGDAIVIMNQGIVKRYIWLTGVVIRYEQKK